MMDSIVRKNLLEAHDLAREIGDVLLRFVDDGEARLDTAQCFGGLCRGLLEARGEPAIERVDPAGKKILKLGLAGERLRETSGDFVLGRGYPIQAALQLRGSGSPSTQDEGKHHRDDQRRHHDGKCHHDKGCFHSRDRPIIRALTRSRRSPISDSWPFVPSL
jgi:hypothetical protein